MTDHLPECPVAGFVPPPAPEPLIWPRCICPALRACEQRVREYERLTDRSGWYKTGWDDGYAACKDDAANAVMALLTISSYGTAVGQVRDDALAAIDALRGAS